MVNHPSHKDTKYLNTDKEFYTRQSTHTEDIRIS